MLGRAAVAAGVSFRAKASGVEVSPASVYTQCPMASSRTSRAKGSGGMVLPQIQYMLACENATLDMAQNLSLTGLMERLLATGFPTMTPSFYIVFGFQNVLPAVYRTRLVIEHTDGTQILAQDLQDTAVPSHMTRARVIVGLKGFIWPKEGDYVVKMFLSGQLAGAFTLQLVQGGPQMITPPQFPQQPPQLPPPQG